MVSAWSVNLLAAILALAQLCCICTMLRRLKTKWWPSMTRFVAGLRRDGFEQAMDPKVQDVIDEALSARRLQVGGCVIFTVWVMLSFYGISCLDQLLSASLVNGIPGEILSVTGCIVIVTPASMFQDWFATQRSRTTLIWLCSAVLCSRPWVSSAQDWQQFDSARYALATFVMSCFFLRFRTIALPSFLVTASCIAHQWSNSESDELVVSFAIESISLWMITSGIALGLDFAMQRSARSEALSGIGKSQQCAVSSLLNLMCDAVVDLDDQLHLTEHSLKLSSLLMHGPGKSLCGEPLSSFIPDSDDKQRLQAALYLSSNGSGTGRSLMPNMLTVGLRDAIGNRIKTTLFHVPYLFINNRVHHFIGLREDTDFGDSTSNGRVQHREPIEAVLRHDLADRLQLVAEVPITTVPLAAGGGGGGADDRVGGGGGLCGGVSGARSSGGLSLGSTLNVSEKPDFRRRSIEVELAEGLPIRWSAEEVKNELGFDVNAIRSKAKFCERFKENGDAFYHHVCEIIDEERSRDTQGHFDKFVGDWDLIPRTMPRSGPAQPIKCALWVRFHLPLLLTPEHGGRIAIAVSLHDDIRRKHHANVGSFAASSSSRVSISHIGSGDPGLVDSTGARREHNSFDGGSSGASFECRRTGAAMVDAAPPPLSPPLPVVFQAIGRFESL